MKRWAAGHHLIMFATLVATATAHAAIGREKLADVVAGTDVIVLAQVASVEGLPNGDWKAVAKVMEVWKGASRDAVTYGPAVSGDAAGCDASGARVGETVVLFLVPERNRISDTLRIAYSGYGRLPVVEGGVSRFVYLGSFFLPAELQLVDPKDPVDRPRVAIERLREFVKTVPPSKQNAQ